MKYIIIEREMNNSLTQVLPIVFPSSLIHAEVAETNIQLMMKQWGDKRTAYSVVSAGEINMGMGVVKCGGRSDSLGVVSRKQDATIIEMIDYLSFR